MTSIHEEASLKRNVYVQNRVKTDNESIYYVVNDIYNAMQTNKQISFLYMEWDVSKKMVARHGGERYCISPYALTIKDENYYLIAYDDEAGKIKHYRVDKIKDIRLEASARLGMDKFEQFDVATYTNMSFGMFGGENNTVTLELPQKMIGIIIDRFGSEVDIRRLGDEKASARVKVTVSNQFFGWVSSLGDEVKIIAPADVLNQYKSFLKNILSKYE